MANITAQADFEFLDGVLDYGSTITSDPLLFSVNNQSGNQRLDFYAFLFGGAFNYTFILGVGEVPVSGNASGLTIKNASGNQTLAQITGLNLPANGHLNGAFHGVTLYPAMFGGNDVFDGGAHAVVFYGDYGSVDSAGYRQGGNDTLADGINAASGKIVGDIGALGTSTQYGGIFAGGDDTLIVRAANSTAIGDADTVKNGELIGGDDNFQVTSGTGSASVAGDVWNLSLSAASVIGGDDNMDFSAGRSGTGTDWLIGDVYSNGGGHVFGGDDIIKASNTPDTSAHVIGDVYTNSGSVTGGDDSLWGNTTYGVAGDVYVNDGAVTGGDDVLHETVGVDFLVGDVINNEQHGVVMGGNDTLSGGDGNDILIGDVDINNGIIARGGDDVLDGGAGDDRLYGDVRQENSGSLAVAGGKDTLHGGAGIDLLYGGGGDDKLYGDDGSDTLHGGNGDDLLDGGDGGDELHGGNNQDHLEGGRGDDDLFGDAQADSLWGGYGADTLHGGKGNDDLHGGAQADTLWGDDNTDTLHGGNGDDKLHGGAQTDELWGENNNDRLYGDGGNDFLHGGGQADGLWGGTGNDELWGDNGDDTLHGDAQADILHGGNNNDTLYGGAGNDQLHGDGQNDALFGGLNNDILDGGTGNDALTGGGQADTFIFSAGYDADTIKDFQNNVDKIDLTSFSFASTAVAMGHASQSGANVVFDFGGGDTLTILNATLAQVENDLILM